MRKKIILDNITIYSVNITTKEIMDNSFNISVLLCVLFMYIIYLFISNKRKFDYYTLFQNYYNENGKNAVGLTIDYSDNLYKNIYVSVSTTNEISYIEKMEEFPIKAENGAKWEPKKPLIIKDTPLGYTVGDRDFKCPQGWLWDGKKCKLKSLCSGNKGLIYKGLDKYYFKSLITFDNTQHKFAEKVFAECNGETMVLRYCKPGEIFTQKESFTDLSKACKIYDPCLDLSEGTIHREPWDGTVLSNMDYYICKNGNSKKITCSQGTIFNTELQLCDKINPCLKDANYWKLLNANSFETCKFGTTQIIYCKNGVNIKNKTCIGDKEPDSNRPTKLTYIKMNGSNILRYLKIKDKIYEANETFSIAEYINTIKWNDDMKKYYNFVLLTPDDGKYTFIKFDDDELKLKTLPLDQINPSTFNIEPIPDSAYWFPTVFGNVKFNPKLKQFSDGYTIYYYPPSPGFYDSKLNEIEQSNIYDKLPTNQKIKIDDRKLQPNLVVVYLEKYIPVHESIFLNTDTKIENYDVNIIDQAFVTEKQIDVIYIQIQSTFQVKIEDALYLQLLKDYLYESKENDKTVTRLKYHPSQLPKPQKSTFMCFNYSLLPTHILEYLKPENILYSIETTDYYKNLDYFKSTQLVGSKVPNTNIKVFENINVLEDLN